MKNKRMLKKYLIFFVLSYSAIWITPRVSYPQFLSPN